MLPTRYGFANYRFVLSQLIEPITNSLLLAAVATGLSVITGVLAAYAGNRKGARLGRGIDLIVMLPFVMPGLLTGVAFLVTFNTGWLVLSGSAWIMILAYVVHRLAYIFRAAAPRSVRWTQESMRPRSSAARAGPIPCAGLLSR